MNDMLRSAVDTMARAVAERLGGEASVWLYGSVVLDDFRPGWSDIDFLALADGPISEETAAELLMLRQRLTEELNDPIYRSFEGVIANREEYLSGLFRRLVYWGTSGQRITDRYVTDVFSRYELAEYGVCVYGDPDRSIFKAPSYFELKAAVRDHYDSIRKYAVVTDESLYSCGWLLDIARCVYTLREGGVISKTAAGRRALEEGLFVDGEPLRKTLVIRENPLEYRDRAEVRAWLSSLGPTVQSYADVLGRELEAADNKNE